MTEPEMKSEKPVQSEVHRDRNQTNDHRQMPLIERIESRREHFHPRIAGQPDRIKTQSRRRLHRRLRGKSPVLINQRDDWFGENDQADRGRNREQHDQPHGVRERAAKFLRVAQRRAPRNERQGNGRDRDAENAERKLHETKSDVEPGDGTIA